jgi:phosphoribosylamine-glycine ligase
MILWIGAGSSNALARAVNKNHPTTLYLDWAFAREKHMYTGLIPQVAALEDGLKQRPDAVVFDGSGNGIMADNLRKWLPVWGAGSLQDDLEENRGWCITLMHACGLNVPRTVIFDPAGSVWAPGDKQVSVVRGWVNEAIAFVQGEGRSTRWILKPYEAEASSTTYISDASEDMVEKLKDLSEEHQIPKNSPFLLQEFVEGIECSTEAWIQDGKIIPGSFNHTIELKKAFAFDLGPSVGSASSTVWCPDGGSSLVEQTFGQPKLQQWLLNPTNAEGQRVAPFHGPLDLNTIIAADGKAYFLEATPRMGWMAYFALKVLLPEQQLGEIFLHAAQGRLTFLPHLKGQYGYELTIGQPPYPATEMVSSEKHMGRLYRELLEPATSIEITGPISHPAINWIDVKIGKKGDLETAGVFGQIASLAFADKKLERARDQAHTLFKEIHLPDKFGRLDGADRAIEMIPKLKKLGIDAP